MLRSRPGLLLPVHSLVCLAAFSLALPLAISLFPQMSQVRRSLYHHPTPPPYTTSWGTPPYTITYQFRDRSFRSR